MDNCIFCDIANGKLKSDALYENDRIIVIRDIHPKANTHLLLISKKHIVSLAQTTAEDAQLLSEMMLLLPVIAKEQGLIDGFRTIINTGPGGGQEVPHLHIHLLGGGRLPAF